VHGRYGPCDGAAANKPPKGAKKPRGGGAAAKPKKPPKTDEERTAERDAKRAAREAELTAEQAKNLTKVGDETDLGDHLANLNQFAQGKPLRPEDIDFLAKEGLLEIGSDGVPRKSEQANVLLNAAKRGDVQGAKDAASRARDQVAKRSAAEVERTAREAKKLAAQAEREAAQAEREAERAKKPGKAGASGASGADKPAGKPAQRRAGRSGGAVAAGGGSSVRGPTKPEPEKIEKPTKAQEQEANRAAVRDAMAQADQGLSPNGFDMLMALGAGAEPDARGAVGLIVMGLAEMGSDNVLRLSSAGRSAIAAANRGDAKAAIDVISRASEPPKKKKESRSYLLRRKEQTAQQRAMFANMGGGGSGGGGGGRAGAGKGGKGGGQQATLWNKNAEGKRVPQAGFAGTKHTPGESERKDRTPAKPAGPAAGTTVGTTTKAYGNDPNQSYTMRHELVDMGSIQASNTANGGINPKYDATLQPRDRSRESSQAQIAQVAQNMNPEVMTTDFHRIDAGTPIIDKNGNVLSGNGRTLALQRAAEMHPDKYAAYKDAIKAEARAAGIDPATVDKMQNPVLVRRLQGDHDAAAFAREANTSGTLRMSPLEQAKVDAGQISNQHMLKLHVSDSGDIDRALRDKANKPFIDDFLAGVPDNERANLLTRHGELNQMGLYRVKAAVYTRAFPGAAGERMAESMLESLDPDIKTVQNGISGGLPDFSRATALTRSGMRDPNLDISDDFAKTVDVYARIKDNPSLTANTPANQVVAKYLGQSSMFDRELNADQERLLVHLDTIARKPTEVRSLLQRYARIVEGQPQPGQASLFGDTGRLTRAELYDQLLGGSTVPIGDAQVGMFG
jgi:hypothetical protein